MSLETKHLYEFGNFRLDCTEKFLFCDGKPVSLTPKVFETLEILIENAGHLLGKDELISKIWQDRLVEESNLTFNIKMLRKALGDSASEPRFIETVPRRGYRFIHEVKEIYEEVAKNPPAVRTVLPRKSYLPLSAAIFLLLGTFTVASWMTRNKFSDADSAAPILSAAFHAEKFTNAGKVAVTALSPDGKFVVFSNETAGKYGVWLRHLETSENIQLIAPSDDYYFGFAFAHDGQTIYFVRRKQTGTNSADIYRVSVFGGVPEKILEHAEGWISLSPDDRQISFVRCPNRDGDYCSLIVADTNGANERNILTRPRPVRLTDNQFSPDGKSIAFAAGESFNGASDFRLLKIELDTGAESEISPHRFFEILNLKWLSGSSLLLTAREMLDGKSEIRQVSAATGVVRQLTNDATDYTNISLDRDADKLIAVQDSNDFQLYFSNGGVTKALTAAREAVFMPDGKIVYAADDGNLWTVNRDGSEQRQLTHNAYKDFMPYADPGGEFIYFTSNRTGANQIWRMNADGTSQIQITKTEGGYPVFVSPDGNWIYYESGLHQSLWKVAADGSREVQVSDRKLYRPAISPDGVFAAFFFRDRNNQNKIAVMQIADKNIVKTLDLADAASAPVQIVWSADNQTISYVNHGNSTNSLWAQRLDENAPRMIADLGDRDVEYFARSADDGSYIFTRGEWLHDAVLIDGLK